MASPSGAGSRQIYMPGDEPSAGASAQLQTTAPLRPFAALRAQREAMLQQQQHQPHTHNTVLLHASPVVPSLSPSPTSSSPTHPPRMSVMSVSPPPMQLYHVPGQDAPVTATGVRPSFSQQSHAPTMQHRPSQQQQQQHFIPGQHGGFHSIAVHQPPAAEMHVQSGTVQMGMQQRHIHAQPGQHYVITAPQPHHAHSGSGSGSIRSPSPAAVPARGASSSPGLQVSPASNSRRPSPHASRGPSPNPSPRPHHSPSAAAPAAASVGHAPPPPKPSRASIAASANAGAVMMVAPAPKRAAAAAAVASPSGGGAASSPAGVASPSASAVPGGSPSPPVRGEADPRLQKASVPAPLLQRMATMTSNPEAAQLAAREAARPNIPKAERHRNLTCPRKRDTSKGTYTPFSIWKFTDREFLQYGLGVMLWFKLVRRLAWLFFFLFLLNLPSLIFNLHGPDESSVAYLKEDDSGTSATSVSTITPSSSMSRNASLANLAAQQTSFGLARTMLANQGLTVNATIFGYSKESVGLVTGALDTFSCIVFLAVVFWMTRDHRHHAATYNSSVMTVRRFTVLVTGLPQSPAAPTPSNPPLGRLQIAEWFSSHFGQVVDVSINYDDMEIISLFRERGEIRRDILNAEAQGEKDLVAKLRKKLKSHDATLLLKKRTHTRKIRAAFVTFQTQESVSKCLATFPSSWWRRCLMKKDLLFRGVKLKVERAAEPSNTLFNNLGLSSRSQACRRMWTGVVSLALMSLSFTAVFVSEYYQRQIPSTTTCAQASVRSQEEVTDTSSKFCYCGSLSATELYHQQDFCNAYLVQYSIAKGLVFMTAASTVIVNALLQMFMAQLASLERHESVTSQQRGITKRLFWGLFFNTGVIILAVNADLVPYVGSKLLPGKFSDFTPDWFYDVGQSILITMLINSMNPHLKALLAIPWDNWRRAKCAKYQSTQSELNQLYQGRTFMLAERYSVLLVTVFVCMMFSAGMPLLWLVGAFTFFSCYWFDKTSFLRSYRIPPRYDESLDEYAANILPMAVLPHLLLALWFFSSPMTSSLSLGGGVPLVGSSALGPIRQGSLSLRQRLLQWNTFPAALLLALLGGVFVARRALALIFFCRASEAEQRSKRLGAEEKRSRTRLVTYTEACAKVGLESYRMSKQHDYRLAYLVTESKKQLPLEMDLAQLREWEANQLKPKEEVSESESSPSEESGSDSESELDPNTEEGKKKAAAVAAAAALAAQASPLVAHKYSVVTSPPPVHANGGSVVAWGGNVPPTDATQQQAGHLHPQPHANGHHHHHHHHHAHENRVHPSPRLVVDDGSGAAGAGGVKSPSVADMASHAAGPSIDPAPIASPHAQHAYMPGDQVDVALHVAAAVANPLEHNPAEQAQRLGFALLPISCPSCAHTFQIVDCGEAMSYTCPFCQTQTIL